MSFYTVWIVLGVTLSLFIAFKLRGNRFVPQLTLIGAKGQGKTRLFCALAYGVVPRTLPSAESQKCDCVVAVTQSRAVLHDFHSDLRKWPKNAFQVLYRSLLNVLVVTDRESIQYFRTVITKYPFVRKGLTICSMADLEPQSILDEVRLILREFGLKPAHIERDMATIRVVCCRIGENVIDIGQLVKIVSATL